MSRPAVVIGFAEALAAPEVAWSLVEDGFDVVAFSRRGRKPPLRRELPVVEIEAPERDADRARLDVEALLAERRPAAVMPLDDVALWLCDGVDAGGARIVGPTGARAEAALDKRIQVEAAARAGFQVPATRWFASPAAVVAERFPVVVKPARCLVEVDGVVRRGAHRVCADARELERALAGCLDAPVLVQELVEGVGEGLFGLADGRTVAAWSAHRRLRMMNPAGSGSSACTAMPVDDDLVAPAERLLAELGWSGLFMIELLRDRDGRPWFMELNGRPWGSTALARRLGLEYPAWAVRQALGLPVAPTARSNGGAVVCRHLGREIVHLLLVLRGPRSEAERWPPRWRTLRELARVRPGDRWYNWRPGSTALFLDDTLRTVLQEIRG